MSCMCESIAGWLCFSSNNINDAVLCTVCTMKAFDDPVVIQNK